jgi:hypothetical protein
MPRFLVQSLESRLYVNRARWNRVHLDQIDAVRMLEREISAG